MIYEIPSTLKPLSRQFLTSDNVSINGDTYIIHKLMNMDSDDVKTDAVTATILQLKQANNDNNNLQQMNSALTQQLAQINSQLVQTQKMNMMLTQQLAQVQSKGENR